MKKIIIKSAVALFAIGGSILLVDRVFLGDSILKPQFAQSMKNEFISVNESNTANLTPHNATSNHVNKRNHNSLNQSTYSAETHIMPAMSTNDIFGDKNIYNTKNEHNNSNQSYKTTTASLYNYFTEKGTSTQHSNSTINAGLATLIRVTQSSNGSNHSSNTSGKAVGFMAMRQRNDIQTMGNESIVPAALGDATVDPGGQDPLNPIPVSGGAVPLLLLSLSYIGFLIKRNKKKLFSI